MFRPNELPRRRKAVVAAVTVLVAVAVVATAAVVLHADQQLDVTVTVANASDPDGVHHVSDLTVEVTNEGDRPVEPGFSVTHDGHQTVSFWGVSDGPRVLAPGETGTYRLDAPTATAAIPYGVSAVLSVHERGTDRRRTTPLSPDPGSGSSSGSTRDSGLGSDPGSGEAILNPGFRYWEKDPDDRFFTPFRWQAATSTPGSERADLRRTSGGMSMEVADVTRGDGPWGMVGVTQEARFPERISVEATPRTTVSDPGPYPPAATGVELADRNRRVWIVFADVDQREVYYREGELSYILVYVPAEPGERVETTVDVHDLYERYGWRLPGEDRLTVDETVYRTRTVTVLAFAAAYPGDRRERASVEFHRIRADPEPDS